ncbi:MAG TPA: superoxide dismutase family protein [Gammaproteobacteria bacterium]|nr:superoxide dismutase family protein [Gammaproteobacteria bacterium]
MLKTLLILGSLLFPSIALADITVPIKFHNGKSAGEITISETPYGLLFTPFLHGLKPGIHGFHIHQNPSCEDHAMAAGGHLDPNNTGKHLGPYNEAGHLGDLPALYVTDKGEANLPVLAPRLSRLTTVEKHSLMVHEGGDNYSDVPEKLGGGGTRMVCGVIP